MSGNTEKNGNYFSKPDRQPIDDMRDGKDIQQWKEPLGQIISHIHTTLFENYSGYDTDSIRLHNRHNHYSFFAVLCGSIAIEVAIIQVFLIAQGIASFDEYLKVIEVISFCFASLAVVIAVISHCHKGWLKKRFMAEKYRLLKFRAFLQPDLYCKSKKPKDEQLARWKDWLNAEKDLVEKENYKELQDCVEYDPVSQPPPDISGCTFDEIYLAEFIRYYQDKRLKTQIDYFETRATELESLDELPRIAVSICFISSVIFLLSYTLLLIFPFYMRYSLFI